MNALIRLQQDPAPGSRRAIVIGASLAGLLAARVLAGHYDEILLLERDRLSDEDSPRKGIPHAIHPHGLLARGREVLEQLFPGLTEALLARGATAGDAGSHGLAQNALALAHHAAPQGVFQHGQAAALQQLFVFGDLGYQALLGRYRNHAVAGYA